MNILAHRGWWLKDTEKNSYKAIMRAFEAGYGIETDLRDFNGSIKVSHDIPNGSELSCYDLIELYQRYGANLPLALNIKSDGLQDKLKVATSNNEFGSFSFFFDMSIPDLLGYRSRGLPYYLRASEYEKELPVELIEDCKGVWLDSFKSIWFDSLFLESILSKNKSICFVSPELHGREYKEDWRLIQSMINKFDKKLMSICTDFPKEAREFFNE